MKDSVLKTKLGIKTGHRVLVLNPPDGYLEKWELTGTAQGAEEICHTFDVVHLFAANKAILEQCAAQAMAAVAPNGRLWVSFPKGSSKIQTDLTRDNGWDIITTASPRFMSLISVNEIWSAVRFKLAE